MLADGLRRAGCSAMLRHVGDQIVSTRPKQIAFSGPAGFLGSRVLISLLDAHEHRRAHGLDPGEVVLLSASPGNLMSRLFAVHGPERMQNVRACRVDYYHQHDVDSWHDQLGSLGLGGPDAVFLNLAALAGPVSGRPDAMMAVNYRAPMAAARACEKLGFGHWIQSSTQAVKAERAGQVPYSRWKSMCDFSLARMGSLPVSILAIGMLYSKDDLVVGQRGAVLNMIDLTLLPLTPIMGDGQAPLQPLEVDDAADRLAWLALCEPAARPMQRHAVGRESWARESWARLISHQQRHYTLRMYDAVGPDTLTMIELLGAFARLNGHTLTPVHVDYRNMERVLNVASLGNLNRQFVSLLRSEQETPRKPLVGEHSVFEGLLGPDARLLRLSEVQPSAQPRTFPWARTIRWALKNYGVIEPSISLGVEMLAAHFSSPGEHGATPARSPTARTPALTPALVLGESDFSEKWYGVRFALSLGTLLLLAAGGYRLTQEYGEAFVHEVLVPSLETYSAKNAAPGAILEESVDVDADVERPPHRRLRRTLSSERSLIEPLEPSITTNGRNGKGEPRAAGSSPTAAAGGAADDAARAEEEDVAMAAVPDDTDSVTSSEIIPVASLPDAWADFDLDVGVPRRLAQQQRQSDYDGSESETDL